MIRRGLRRTGAGQWCRSPAGGLTSARARQRLPGGRVPWRCGDLLRAALASHRCPQRKTPAQHRV
jgi:hypothetical protein